MKLLIQLIVAVMLLVCIYAAFAWYEGRQGIYTSTTYTFLCANGSTFTMQYDASGAHARLTLGGEEYELMRERSGSGTRYTNEDKSVSFREHQDEGRIRMLGSTQEMVCRL